TSAGFPMKAKPLVEEALAISRRLDKPEAMFVALLASAHDITFLIESEQTLRDAVKIGREIENWELMAPALGQLGQNLLGQHKYVDARQCGEELLTIVDNPWSRGFAFGLILGPVARQLGEFARAKEHYRKGLAAFEEMTFPWGAAMVYLDLGS